MKKVLFVFCFCLLVVGVVFAIILNRPQIEKQIALVAPKTNSQLDHIVVIVMENESFDGIVGNKNVPYINSLIHTYSFADNYYALARPSLPNYLALIGGSTFGITTDCTDCFNASTNLIDQLENQHKTWKAYMESMPEACFLGDADLYVQKHNPFIYFADIRNNDKRCKNIVPYTQLQADLKTPGSTPNFIWISPNMCHNMHDCSVATGDTWLSQEVPNILQSPAFTKENSLLVIIWDEGEKSDVNKVPAIFIGNNVKRGFTSHTSYTHYSLLHMIENLWGMPALTTDVKQSNATQDIFLNK